MSTRLVRCRVYLSSLPLALLVSALPVAQGCKPAVEAPAAKTQAAEHADGIPWFDGTVEAALAKAKVERRPVFLYWGAVWCPPCQVLKARLFPRPEFRARIASMIPVYLDGDTERAQTWGEKLGTEGYPTVIVLDPDGKEIVRINSLISVAEYVRTLTAALDATKPVGELVTQVHEQGVA